MLEASLERLRDVHGRMKQELARVIVGQDEVLDQLLLAILTRGHCLLVGVPGLAKTLMISSLSETMELDFNRIQFTPDLMPSDITVHIDPETSDPLLPLLLGAHLRQRAAGGRDQPHAAQDPGRPARGHAGAPGHRRGHHPPPARALLRAGHPEPDRAGGHLSPARGPARPLHVHGARSATPARPRSARSCERTTTGATARRSAASAPTSCASCRRRARRPGRRRTSTTTPWRSRAARACARMIAARLRQGVGHLGRRTARQPVPGARRQGPRRPAGRNHVAVEDVRAGGPPGAAPPHRDQLLRPGRGRRLRPVIIDRLLEEVQPGERRGRWRCPACPEAARG